LVITTTTTTTTTNDFSFILSCRTSSNYISQVKD